MSYPKEQAHSACSLRIPPLALTLARWPVGTDSGMIGTSRQIRSSINVGMRFERVVTRFHTSCFARNNGPRRPHSAIVGTP
jgi:hypothetical protein